jgi:hypothetical protein
MAAFPASPKPNYPIEETPVEPEVLVSKHRDGSEQRRLKGAGVRRQFRLGFGNSCPITQAQVSTFLAHWTTQQGTLTAFTWQHPERTAETYTVRYAEKPAVRLIGYNAYEMNVVLQEVLA